jgi:hypothetical protein
LLQEPISGLAWTLPESAVGVASEDQSFKRDFGWKPNPISTGKDSPRMIEDFVCHLLKRAAQFKGLVDGKVEEESTSSEHLP